MKKPARPASATFHAVTHVWGREYLDVFLNVCLPNQLAPGNVPALPPGSRYRILTRSTHVDELSAHPMVSALRAVLPVDIVVVEALDRQLGVARGQDLMIACHQQSVADALAMNAAVLFLSADFVFSSGALAAVVRRHREGFRAVVNTGVRLNKESFLEVLARSGAPLDGLSPRELVRLAQPHLHAHTRSMFADARPFSRFPVAVYWRVGDDGMLARCLHLHPLMVDPMHDVVPRGSNDGRFVLRACPDASRVHVVADSDELQMYELTPAARTVVPAGGAGASAWRAAAVAAACDSHQLGYWERHPIRLHAGDIDGRWTPAESAAAAFVDRVVRLRPYGDAARRWFLFLEHSRQRRERYWRAVRRRRPPVSVKQVLRPLRIATSRSGKALRRGTRRVLRHVTVR
jgi:hypothetical protein